MRAFLSSHKIDLILIFLIVLTAPLFFYKLGQSSLVSWDEAWYGEIARNILKSGDLLNLTWNGRGYFDHPPAGFWLITLSLYFFGVSEFSARFVPALAGFISTFLIYFLGKEIFNRQVGFLSAIALSSSIWFLYRARSGNLDTILTMFFILTFLLALKSIKNKVYVILFFTSLSLLILTKTVIPLTIIPVLLVVFSGPLLNRNLSLKRLMSVLPFIIVGVAIFLTLVGLWFLTQKLNKSDFINHYFKIGLPGVDVKPSYIDNLKLAKEYLHSGIGKWFWPGVLSSLLGLVFLQKRFLMLGVFFFSFFMPFIFSQKGHIWHLVPLHPFLILTFFGFFFVALERILKNRYLVFPIIFGVGIYFSFIQLRANWYQFVDIPAYVSDEAILSREAAKYPQPLYIDGDFLPTAVFYSEKNVDQIHSEGIIELFSQKKEFLLITKKERLTGANILENQYSIIKTDRDKILIKHEIKGSTNKV